MSYTENEIKLLKYEKRTGYVLSSIVIIFTFIIDFYIIKIQKLTDWNTFILLNVLLLCCFEIILFLMNRKINKDLLNQEITSIKHKVINKEEMFDYEPGIRFMGMKKHTKYVLTFENETFNVEKNFYNDINIGDMVEIKYSKYSETFLGIYKFL